MKRFILPIVGLMILSGCSMSFDNAKENFDLKGNLVALNNISSSKISQTLANKNLLSDAGYYGPLLSLAYDDYKVKEYTKEDLLFANNGVEANLSLIFLEIGSINYLNQKAQNYGFESFHEMFLFLYRKMNNTNEDNRMIYLNYLRDNGLIDLNSLSTSKINNETNKIIDKLYSLYYAYDNKVSFDIRWTYDNGKRLDLNDYKPYALISILVKDILESKKRINING